MRFTKVPFVIISSLFLLEATILYYLKKKETEVAKKIERDIYMDNVITGENSTNKTVKNSTNKTVTFYHQAKLIFQNASMNLRAWISNLKSFCQIYLKLIESKNVKILGMYQNTCSDLLAIAGLSTIQMKVTIAKRDVLSMIAAIFEPAGYLCPVIIKAKLFTQQLWGKNMSWVDPLRTSLRNKWAKIVYDLQNLSKIQIPRYINTERDGTEEYQLIYFCDASGKAYAMAVYIRVTGPHSVKVNLIFAKAQVAPKEELTLPCLELLGTLIGKRSTHFVKKHLDLPTPKTILWTDAQCILHWLKTKKLLSVSVEIRLKEIKNGNISLRFVISEDNLADLATRGISALELSESQLWWHGPKWLRDQETSRPAWNIPEINSETIRAVESEIRGPHETSNLAAQAYEPNVTSELTPDIQSNVKPEDYSSLNHLLRLTVWVLRFIKNYCH